MELQNSSSYFNSDLKSSRDVLISHHYDRFDIIEMRRRDFPASRYIDHSAEKAEGLARRNSKFSARASIR